jgi:hypothetical protein
MDIVLRVKGFGASVVLTRQWQAQMLLKERGANQELTPAALRERKRVEHFERLKFLVEKGDRHDRD